MAETLAQLMKEVGRMSDENAHEGLDDRWRPYLDKKVVVVFKEPVKGKGRATGFLKHYGSWEHASVLISTHMTVDAKFDNVKSVKLWEPKPTVLKSTDIQVGRWYRSHRPRRPFLMGEYDDRYVLHVGFDSVQYDSNTVANGRRYPTVTMNQFLQWAAKDVTDEIKAEIAKEKAANATA